MVLQPRVPGNNLSNLLIGLNIAMKRKSTCNGLTLLQPSLFRNELNLFNSRLRIGTNTRMTVQDNFSHNYQHLCDKNVDVHFCLIQYYTPHDSWNEMFYKNLSEICSWPAQLLNKQTRSNFLKSFLSVVVEPSHSVPHYIYSFVLLVIVIYLKFGFCTKISY